MAAPMMALRLRSLRPIGDVLLPSLSRLSLSSSAQPIRFHSESKTPPPDETVSFGFQKVPASEKQSKVDQVFHNVAEKYDLMNDAMSMFIHRVWKDQFVERLGPTANSRIVDVAGGTGDIALRMVKFIKNRRSAVRAQNRAGAAAGADAGAETGADAGAGTGAEAVERQAKVVVCDINESMLKVGRHRAEAQGHGEDIDWVCGNAEKLPFSDNSFDAFTIAFGIRNCTNIDKVLAEAYRVLRPGGRFLCLEFSRVENPILRRIYDEYSFQVIPVMGQLLARDWNSYQYLVESIRQFPVQSDFAQMIRDAGFRMVSFENLSLGICCIHSGFKLVN